MLAIAPELVRLDRAAPGNTESVGELLGDLVARGVRPLAANGVLRDPAGASAREGRELLAAAVADFVAVVDAWAAGGGGVKGGPAGCGYLCGLLRGKVTPR